MMKKSILIVTVTFVLFTLTACSSTTFDGSRTGNESQLIMDYRIMNKTDSQTLELQEGDSVDFVIASESGKVNIIMQKENNEPIYQGTDIPTSSFRVEIEETGSYQVTVTGEKAKGSISVVRVEND